MCKHIIAQFLCPKCNMHSCSSCLRQYFSLLESEQEQNTKKEIENTVDSVIVTMNKNQVRKVEPQKEVKKWICILPPVHNLLLRIVFFFWFRCSSAWTGEDNQSRDARNSKWTLQSLPDSLNTSQGLRESKGGTHCCSGFTMQMFLVTHGLRTTKPL